MISAVPDSTLLQVPMSVQFRHSPLMNGLKQFYDKLRGKNARRP